MLYSPYVLAPVVAAVVLFVVAAAGFRSRHVPGALAFGVSMLLSGIWDLTYALEVAAPDLRTKILAEQLRFPALAVVPVSLFWMALDYAGHRAWLTRARAAALLSITAVTAVLGFTMPYHTLLRFNFRVVDSGHLSVLLFDLGPWFQVHALYSNALLLATVAVLATSLRGAPLVYRGRTVVLIASILLPSATNLLFLAADWPVPGYNISPALTMFTGLLLVWGVFGLRLMELVPIARTTVVDNMADLVFVLNSQGQVVDANRAAERILGVRHADLVGKPAATVFQPWDEVCRRLRLPAAGKEEVTFGHEQGGGAYQISISQIHDRGGGVLGRVVMLHDVTELRRAREAAESADRAKSVFLASVSHEIRTPMNVILGFAQLMARDRSLPAEYREQLDLIRSSGEHLLSLLSDTLDLSKIEAGRMAVEPVSTDLHAFVASVQQLFQRQAERKGIAFSAALDPDLPRYVRADARRLRQILINLLSNALKFTPTGSVALRLSCLPEAGAASTQMVRFEVEDTGTGIAPLEMATLFDPFKQAAGGRAAQDGTGLGLALSRQLARLMGGDLHVTSQLGLGSSFVMDLPLAVLPSQQIASQPALAERRVLGVAPGQPQRRVLVVDDHAPGRRLLVSQLAALNAGAGERPVLDVREAGSAGDALAAWDSWRPDLIFLDMRLPDRSGSEVAAEVRRRLPDEDGVVIVGLSASVLEEDRAEFLRAGCDSFLGKPYREREIPAVLAQYLGVRFLYDESTPGG